MRIQIKEIDMFNDFINSKTKNILKYKCRGITTDSRLVQKGDLFVAIKGENLDGNSFVSHAIEADAGMVVCDSWNGQQKKIPIIKVQSSKQYLKETAYEWKNKFNIPFIGVTGSNGKTTTKELLYYILSPKYNCMKTTGNVNSTVGIPLSLFSLSKKNTLSIIEIGASHPGEIKYITEIIKPTYALITNISNAHIQNYNNITELLNNKLSIFKYMNNNGVAFINNDIEGIKKSNIKSKYITYGFKNKSDFNGIISDKDSNQLTLSINDQKIKVPYSSKILAKNILAVYAICKTLNISESFFSSRLSTFKIPEGRGNIISSNGFLYINDAYNANLESYIEGLENFSMNYENFEKKILLIGDMLELGKETKDAHIKLGKIINKLQYDVVFGYGKYIHDTIINIKNEKTKTMYSNNIDEIALSIQKHITSNSILYVKGSRGMQMENIIKKIKI